METNTIFFILVGLRGNLAPCEERAKLIASQQNYAIYSDIYDCRPVYFLMPGPAAIG